MNRMSEPITLKRDCQAVLIPSGFSTVLEEGTEVRITQSLGGTHTVMTPQGLARIGGEDADVLGLEKEVVKSSLPASGEVSREDLGQAVWDQLRTCFDPEIPVNIVDLGLVYSCLVTPCPEGGHRVEVKFTLTAPGCGMGDWLRTDMQSKIEGLPGVKETEIEVVFEPPWSQEMMSDAAKLELGMM